MIPSWSCHNNTVDTWLSSWWLNISGWNLASTKKRLHQLWSLPFLQFSGFNILLVFFYPPLPWFLWLFLLCLDVQYLAVYLHDQPISLYGLDRILYDGNIPKFCNLWFNYFPYDLFFNLWFERENIMSNWNTLTKAQDYQ